jgi:signal transduction histidine kinase
MQVIIRSDQHRRQLPSLRQTVLLTLGLGFALLTAVQAYLAHTFVQKQLLEIETRAGFERLATVHRAMELLEHELASTTADWADWDQSYAFVSGANSSYAADNLGLSTFVRLRLSAIVMVDRNGQVIYAAMSQGDAVVAAPPELMTLAQRDAQTTSTVAKSNWTGLVATAGGGFLVSSQVVLDSNRKLPPRGRLLMARSLPATILPNIAIAAAIQLSVQPLAAVPSDRDQRGVSILQVSGRDTLRLTANEVQGFTPLDDFAGRPFAVVEMRTDRPMLAMLSSARTYLLLSTLVVGMVFCAVALLMIRAKILKPLEALADTVAKVGTHTPVATRFNETAGAREFATLSAALNKMLQQIEAQQALQKDRDAAIEANRLKSEFLAIMSHEIRTPMNGVLGMCELLHRTELNPRQKYLADTILTSAQSLLELLNDILDFSKIESGKLHLEVSEFSALETITSVSKPFMTAAQTRGLAYSLQLDPRMPALVMGDEMRLRQVLTNLLGNASKFTQHGSLTLRCEVQDLTYESVQLRFTVTDTGIGIAKAALPEIFEAFEQGDSTTARRYGGSGLGLAIVRRLVELMGGRVGVDSEEGQGSAFWFTIPLRIVTHARTLPAAVSTMSAARFDEAQAPLVLLAEDNTVNREVITEMLEYFGCRVTAVENGAQALAAAAAATFDAVLMDCQMPVMDGHAATAELRVLEQAAARKRTLIVALTADVTAENHRRCLEAGMDYVVTKPISHTRLRELIERAMQG